MSACKDEYKKSGLYKFGYVNACVYRPILTPEENKRRMERVAEACAAVMNEALGSVNSDGREATASL